MDPQTQTDDAAPEQDQAPARIDEQSRRKPGFDPDAGEWIELDDGQEWCFPRPLVRLRYSGTQVGFVRRARFPGQKSRFDPEFGRLLQAASDDTVSMAEYWKAQLAVAAYLLRVHYNLADEEVTELISLQPFDRDDPDNAAFNRIMALAYGFDGPKPSAAGPGSPSS